MYTAVGAVAIRLRYKIKPKNVYPSLILIVRPAFVDSAVNNIHKSYSQVSLLKYVCSYGEADLLQRERLLTPTNLDRLQDATTLSIVRGQ